MSNANHKKYKNNYTKFAGLSSQMISTVIFFSLIGYGIDYYTEFNKPYFLGVFCVVGVVAGMYFLLKSI
ncbi:MAG: AtpZ/AtpI family protein [Solirubrobacteraceae bacterium]|jgi:F0F1-type ATP synthase assembly protein I